MYLPILIVIIYSFNENKLTAIWSGFSLKWYTELLKDKDLMEALKNSFILCRSHWYDWSSWYGTDEL